MNDANNAGTLAPKVRLLLQMLQSANGQIDASDHRNSLLNYFCDDNGRETDTFNLAIKFGFIRVTHDSHFETSTAYLIDVGREAALSTPNEREAIARAIYDVSSRWIAPNFPKGWKPRSFEELEDIERRLHFAYADAILADRLDEAAIRKDEREKCLNQVCESLFVLADGWKEQPGKEETATAVSNAAVFICGKERAIAIARIDIALTAARTFTNAAKEKI
jgi:hypothetical protein